MFSKDCNEVLDFYVLLDEAFKKLANVWGSFVVALAVNYLLSKSEPR